MNRYILAVLFVATSYCSAAEEKQTPTDAFRGQTQFHMMKCQLEEKLAITKLEMGEANPMMKVADCIKNGKAETKKPFALALKSIGKNKEAAKLLKDYYATWITAIDGVLPGMSETKMAHSARQQNAEVQYDGIWNRFEIEAGI